MMPLRMLRALGRNFSDLIEIEVVVSTFTGEFPKTLGVFPIDNIVGSKTSLSVFFMINSTANYNALLGRDCIHSNWCVSSSLHQFLLFWKGDEGLWYGQTNNLSLQPQILWSLVIMTKSLV